MLELITNLLSPSQYIPHGHCYLWQTPLVLLHIISDALIAMAYFSIPVMLIYFVRNRKDIPFSKVFVLFGAFIILCGTGHLLEIWTLWHPTYWVSGVEKAMTALVSCYTALKLVELLPQFLALQTPEQLEIINHELERQILERQRTDETLRTIVAGTSSVTGNDFFPALVQTLATSLDVAYVVVSETVDGSLEKLRSLALWSGNQLAENIEYSLPGTPCEEAMKGKSLCVYPDRLQNHFPKVLMFKDMRADSYMGAPLLDANQRAIGHLCILDVKPFLIDDRTQALFKVFAARAATELQRKWAEDEKRCAYEELEFRVAERTAELVATNVALETEVRERIVAETALKQSQEQFSKAFHSNPIACCISTLQDGLFLDVNVSFLNLFGFSREEVIGHNSAELEIWADQANQEHWMGAFQQQKSVQLDAPFFIRSGEVRQGMWSFETFELHGKTCLLSMIYDITERTQAEKRSQKLLKELSDFKYALDQAAIVEIADAEGKITYANDNFCQVSGYSQAELIGQNHRLINSGYHSAKFFRDFWSTLCRGEVWRGEMCNRAKDGSFFWLDSTMVPFLDAQGQPFQYLAIRTNVTARKEAETALRESEARFRNLADTAPVLIWMAGLDKGCYYFNQPWLDFTGHLLEQEIANGWASGIHPEFVQRCMATYITAFEARQEFEMEYQRQRHDGEYRWLLDHGVPRFTPEGHFLGYIGSCIDISDRKIAESQLRKTNGKLVIANAELARATRLKDEFLANMSHELRTPLNAILGMSEVLQEGTFGRLNDRQSRAIATIDRSGNHLLELITDILDLAKIESGKLELQIVETSIRNLCDISLTFVKQLALKRNIHLSFQISDNISSIYVDDRRLRQVLINLLNNAVKFTPAGGSVRLEVGLQDSEGHSKGRGLNVPEVMLPCSLGIRVGDKGQSMLRSGDIPIPSSPQITFSVIDTGIGVAPENLNDLFQSFVQIDSSLNRQYSGTGLGLALVKRIVELHNGTVSVQSTVGKGSCFTVKLPYRPATGNLLPLEQPSCKLLSAAMHRALIIEDALLDLGHVTRYLEELEIEVTSYVRGEGAVEMVQQVQPDVIFMDVRLPNLSGWEVLSQLKANPQTQQVPVIITSVLDERSHGLALGAAEYLVKPITRDRLRAALCTVWQSLQSGVEEQQQTQVLVNSASPLILMAEDNESNVESLGDYLVSRGYRLILAKNGQEAIHLAEAEKPDLILMDIQMPGMDGLEATHRIRANPALAQIPILALTALALPGDREKCLAAGVNDYLTKPFRFKELISIIHRLLPPRSG